MNSSVSASTVPHHRPSAGRTSTTTTTTTTSTSTISTGLSSGHESSSSGSTSGRDSIAATTISPASAASPPLPGTSIARTNTTTTTASSASRSPGTPGSSPHRVVVTTTTAASSPSHRNSSGACSSRVVFGYGAVSRLPSELNHLRLSSPLVVSSPSRISLARRVQSLIPNLDSRILDSALVNVPQRVVDDAVARISGRDCVISVGGSSAVRLAKAIATAKEIPHICIPTTYSGSEMPLLGDPRRRGTSKSRGQQHVRENGKHRSGNSSTGGGVGDADGQHSKPTIIIYDEDLTSTSTSMTISAPSEARPILESRCHHADDDALWSYIHLPGV